MTLAGVPQLAVHAVSKAFPGVQALRDVSFECHAGEIHALVGENGAGKSTLMRILAGVHRPDSGEIEIARVRVSIGSPAEALRRGIAMVYQDTRLIPDLDAAQNIFLGREPGGMLLDTAAIGAAARERLARLGERFDVRRPVGQLSVAQRQIVEIARALGAEASILILDEPTSALTAPEVEQLFAVLKELAVGGTAVIFVSHRLPEVFAIAETITVLKDGAVVGTVKAAESDHRTIVQMMVGRDLALAFPPRAASVGATVLGVSHLDASDFSDVSFEVRAGEIVGFGGITGSGQQAIVRALFGLGPASGEIQLDGERVTVTDPAAAIGRGIVYLPSDRRGEGLFLPHSVRENIGLPHLSRWAQLGIVDTGLERREVAKEIDALKIRTPNAEQPVGLLSGGNQQKVSFARWLLSNPRLCIFDEPTHGVDVGTKLEIYQIIRALAAREIAVIVISSDVLELIGLSDRILVVSNGRIVDEMKAVEASEERVVGSAVGLAETKRFAWQKGRRATAAPARPLASPLVRRYGSVLLLALMTLFVGAYAATHSEYFFTTRNMANFALQLAPLLIVSLGQLAVILVGGIDLSAGPNISLTTAIASFLLIADPPAGWVAGIVMCLAAGILIGAVNGLLIEALKLPDLIATLATYSVVAGLALIVRPAPGGVVSGNFADLVLMRVGSVPVAFLVAIASVALFELLLIRGRVGLRLYAVGSSGEGALVAGIAVARVHFCAYLFCGLMAAVAGLIIAARIGSGDPQSGTNFTLLSITAVVLGGTSIFGGRGTAVGTFVGAALIMLIQNAMNQLHVSAYWQYVWTGLLTLVAVSIYAVRDTPEPLAALARKFMPAARKSIASSGTI